METTSTPRRPKPGTQCAIILDILERTAPGFAGLDILMHQARCGAVHSVIAKLRTTYGFNIENRQRTGKDGRRLSSYRLIPAPAFE
ncbi:hypothetical protein [Haloferula sp. A504]|uniref:hypothetical protein n=1 Tax=Haloferula sp. A504 TaxID=3373601 RepID=UPI0031CB22CE|nr:hypothetical protein [Verrucomicrobiaceae bacterium E54]